MKMIEMSVEKMSSVKRVTSRSRAAPCSATVATAITISHTLVHTRIVKKSTSNAPHSASRLVSKINSGPVAAWMIIGCVANSDQSTPHTHCANRVSVMPITLSV